MYSPHKYLKIYQLINLRSWKNFEFFSFETMHDSNIKIHYVQIFREKKERKEKKTTIRKIEVSNEIASSILPPPKRHRNFACTAIPNTKQLIWKLQKSDISLAELDRHPIKRPHCFETRGLKRGSGVGVGRGAGCFCVLFSRDGVAKGHVQSFHAPLLPV